MGNQVKASHTAVDYNEQSTCPICKEKDSQQHWITCCKESTLPKTRSDYIVQVKKDIRRKTRDRHETKARWMEILLGIAVIRPQGVDVWVGM